MISLFVSLLLFWGVQSFPDGAPIDACVKDRPNQPNHGQHRTQPLTTLPYRVTASSSAYAPNSPITVTIEGGEPFKGFFIQARSVETDQWLGSWEQAPNTTIHPECSSITHADPKDKARATFVWRAPPTHGRVYFTGTVLKNYGTFWSGLIAEAPQDPAQLQFLDDACWYPLGTSYAAFCQLKQQKLQKTEKNYDNSQETVPYHHHASSSK